MEHVEKKQRRPFRHGRWLLVLSAAAVLIAALATNHAVVTLPQEPVPTASQTALTLYNYDPSQVTSLTITRKGESSWHVEQNEEGLMVLTGENGHPLSANTSYELMYAASVITCEAVLSTDPAEYAGELEGFGLTDPELVACITYADGVSVTLRVGSYTSHNTGWRYMTIDGDDRLFAFSKGMTDDLAVSEASLWDVEQPTLHKARIDRLTLRNGSGQIVQEWTLQGQITDMDSLDRWAVTAPITYPADADAMSNLLANTANLRLGAYVGPATPELLTQCGFDEPRMTIEIHMAAGTIGTTSYDGSFTTRDWPESTVTFIIGGAQNDMVDYVRYGDAIYISSHFTMGVFLDLNVRNTMSRYPVQTALGNLQSLAVDKDGTVTTYELIRTEQVAENNELVYDDYGNIVYNVTCTRNGEPCDYTAFEAAYSQLMMVTVSSVLPEGEFATAAPHTVYTFTDVNGTVHTIALATFDALHDAVIINGHQAFYLIKNGFSLNLD